MFTTRADLTLCTLSADQAPPDAVSDSAPLVDQATAGRPAATALDFTAAPLPGRGTAPGLRRGGSPAAGFVRRGEGAGRVPAVGAFHRGAVALLFPGSAAGARDSAAGRGAIERVGESVSHRQPAFRRRAKQGATII